MRKYIALKVIVIFIFLVSPSLFSQEHYAGIEVGSKGVKMSVINVQNIKSRLPFLAFIDKNGLHYFYFSFYCFFFNRLHQPIT